MENRNFNDTRWTENVYSAAQPSTSSARNGPSPSAHPATEHERTADDHDLPSGEIAEARQKAKKAIVIWGLIAAVVPVISIVSYAAADAGDIYLVWWGPAVFGIWRIVTNALVLFRLRKIG